MLWLGAGAMMWSNAFAGAAEAYYCHCVMTGGRRLPASDDEIGSDAEYRRQSSDFRGDTSVSLCGLHRRDASEAYGCDEGVGGDL